MTELLHSIHDRIKEELEGLEARVGGLAAAVDARYGDVVVEVDHDAETDCIRISIALPPPPGAGPEFLVWCLATNARYWDVKIGLDDEGRLLVHSDIDVEVDGGPEQIAEQVLDRVETVLELVDDDIVEWLLDRGLGTPEQLERWDARAPQRDEEGDEIVG